VRGLIGVAVAVTGLVPALSLASPSAAITLNASMSGKFAVPRGSPTGKGLATITIDARKVCWTLTYSGIGKPLASQIRRGAAGSIVVSLGRTFTTRGCTLAPSSAIAQAIVAHPGAYYVNIQTAKYPRGAIRGQLSPAPPPAGQLYRFSFGKFVLSFDTPAHGNPPKSVHISLDIPGGSACGTDPVSAAWSVPYTVTAEAASSGSFSVNFAQANPFRIYNFLDFQPKASLAADLRFVPGASARMTVEIAQTGAVSNVATDPAPPQLAIAKEAVESC
jgi:CHRD domain-containing protein